MFESMDEREPPEEPTGSDDPACHDTGDEPADLDAEDVDGSEVAQAQAWAAVDEVEAAHDRERIDDADPDATLDLVVSAARAERLAQARQLQLAAHWADLHPTLDPALSAAVPGAERLVQLGGDGTPRLAEFAPAELGAVLSITASAAATLMADALDLRHRLPLLWTRMQAGEVKPWLARQVAERSRRLTPTAAAFLDRRIAGLSDTVPWGRLRRVVDAVILAADPPQALTDTEQAEAERGVWVSPEHDHGIGSLFAKADAGDLKAFEAAIALIARALRTLGDRDPVDVRRSRALGIIANPELALALVADAEQHRKARLAAIRDAKSRAAARQQSHPGSAATDSNDSDESDDSGDGDDSDHSDDSGETGETGETGGADEAPSSIRKPFTWGTATLYLHLTKADLDALAKAGVVRAEDIGPLLLDQVRRWLQHRQVVVKPVIDPETIPPVDRYEAPPAMAEALILTKPADFFPHSPNTSRRMDTEHLVPYVSRQRGGPPGQTAVDKLARVGRRNHRVKTHSRWTVTQPRNGTFLWRSPHGRWFLVDQHGTTNLGTL